MPRVRPDLAEKRPKGQQYIKNGRKDGNVLLNTFYLRLYGVRHIMAKYHADSERGNPETG